MEISDVINNSKNLTNDFPELTIIDGDIDYGLKLKIRESHNPYHWGFPRAILKCNPCHTTYKELLPHATIGIAVENETLSCEKCKRMAVISYIREY